MDRQDKILYVIMAICILCLTLIESFEYGYEKGYSDGNNYCEDEWTNFDYPVIILNYTFLNNNSDNYFSPILRDKINLDVVYVKDSNVGLGDGGKDD